MTPNEARFSVSYDQALAWCKDLLVGEDADVETSVKVAEAISAKIAELCHSDEAIMEAIGKLAVLGFLHVITLQLNKEPDQD